MKTAAGFFESAPGYSAYVSNRLEAFWNKLDALVSQPEEYMMLDALLKELRSIHVGWQKDFAFSEFLHFPGGRNFFAPRVMEGEGQYVKLGGLYDKPFRKLTVEKMQRMDKRGLYFYEEFPAVDNLIWTWKRVWVCVKERADHFSRSEAEHFYLVQRADSTEACETALKNAGLLSENV